MVNLLKDFITDFLAGVVALLGVLLHCFVAPRSDDFLHLYWSVVAVDVLRNVRELGPNHFNNFVFLLRVSHLLLQETQLCGLEPLTIRVVEFTGASGSLIL